MLKISLLSYKTLLFLLVFALTFVLRAHNYDRIPTVGHLEEMLYAWSGINLIETGTPVSWSNFDYPKYAHIFKGEKNYRGGEPRVYVDLYKPWLDEPPLFSLISGFFAHIHGAERDDVIPSSYIREPVVILGALTSILVFIVAKAVSGYWMGILSMLIYGTVPIIVFSSRLSVPENLIALIFMIVIYLLLKFELNPKLSYLLPIPLLIGIAGLSKPTGYFILPLALYFAFKKKFYKTCLYLTLATIPFVIIYILYGLHFDPALFWQITGGQGNRPVGFSSLGWFFVSPAYDIFTLTDSWYIFLLLSLAYFLFTAPAGLKKIISLGALYWLAIVMLSGGEGDLLPWYRYPAFPLLSILGAWGVREIFIKADLFSSFLAAGLLLGGRHLLSNAFRPDLSPIWYRLTFIGLMLPSVAYSVYPHRFLKLATRLVILGIVIFGIYFNVIYIYNVFELRCESISCPFGPSTFLSTIHFPIIWKFFVLAEPTLK